MIDKNNKLYRDRLNADDKSKRIIFSEDCPDRYKFNTLGQG